MAASFSFWTLHLWDLIRLNSLLQCSQIVRVLVLDLLDGIFYFVSLYIVFLNRIFKDLRGVAGKLNKYINLKSVKKCKKL